MKKFVKKHKLGLGIVLTALLLVMPFIWPFMLAFLWNIMSVVLPVGAAMVLLRLYDSKKAESEKEKREKKHAYYWYESYGKKRLVRLAEDLRREGFYEAWVHPDGVCKVKTNQGYRRRATLVEYPADFAGLIADKLCADGIQAEIRGKYLHLSFQKRRAA